MIRERKRQTTSTRFSDPIEQYEHPEPSDPLERALTQGMVSQIQHMPYRVIDAQTPVRVALDQMSHNDFFCLMVVRGAKLVGLFSERDVLNRVAEQYDQVKDRPVGDLMTPNPVTVYSIDPPAQALRVMTEGGFRHVPVLNIDNTVSGIIGPKRTTAFLRRYV